MSNVETPKVSVIMSVYNSEEFLRETIDSILSQSLSDFEFIIMDDGSSDSTRAIIESYGDPRIHAYFSEVNRGQSHWYNEAAKLAKSHYIAIAHGDDIYHPQRLEKQFRYLNAHPDVGILGSTALYQRTGFWAKWDKIKTGVLGQVPPHIPLEALVYARNPFVHPSMMLRRKILLEIPYNETYRLAEDYELWHRMLKKHKGAVISEPLMTYRVHGGNGFLREVHKNYPGTQSILKKAWGTEHPERIIKLLGLYNRPISKQEGREIMQEVAECLERLLASGHIHAENKKHIGDFCAGIIKYKTSRSFRWKWRIRRLLPSG